MLGLEREPVAFFEDLIDLMDVPLAVTGRPAGAERCSSRRTALFDRPRPPAREAHGLARYIFERVLGGEETAAQMPGIDGIVVDGGFLLDNRRWWCGL